MGAVVLAKRGVTAVGGRVDVEVAGGEVGVAVAGAHAVSRTRNASDIFWHILVDSIIFRSIQQQTD